MATAVTTFPWLSSYAPWGAPAAGTLNAHAWTGDYGNPVGCIGGYVSANGAGSSGVGTCAYGPTWEDLGVPAGATVTAVEVTQFYTRAGLTHSNASGTARFQASIASSAAGWDTTSLFDRTGTGTDGAAWQTTGSVGSVSVPAGAQASNTVLQLLITLTCTRPTGTGTAESGHYDGLQITVTYTPASVDRTATGGLKPQLPLLTGTATNTPPARSATGSLKTKLPLLTGAATNVPPARTAAGSLKLQLPLFAGTATNVPPPRAGSGGLAAQLPLFSGSATNVPPARTASGGLRVQLPSLGGSATSAAVRSAAGGLALSLPSLGGSATNTPPPRSASGGLALSLPALGGTATNTPPPRTAAGGLRVPLPSLGGAAMVAEAEPRTAAGGLALSAPVLSGTAAQTYPALFFDGIDDVVPLGDLGLCEDGSFTFETVCRPVPVMGTRYVLGESGTVARVGLGVSDGAAYARLVSDTGVTVELTGADLFDDERHYMALAAYGGTAYLYVDGVLADSEALPAGGFTMTATTLGALASAGYWYGEVAVARTYPMGLDATNIAAQYNAWLEWLEHVADADLVATLAPAGFRARLVPVAFKAEQAADGWRARTAPTGFEAEITTPGFATTTRS